MRVLSYVRCRLLPDLVKDGIASVKEANKEFVENISETITAGMLVKLLDE